MNRVETIAALTGYHFTNAEWLEQALRHSSHVREAARRGDVMGEQTHYERLEFLGDTVIDLVVSHLLMERFPKWREGELSKVRASLVNTQALAELGRKFKLGDLAILSEAEAHNQGRERPGMLADMVESLAGAIYLDGGFDQAARIIRPWFESLMADQEQSGIVYDYKTALQELTQSQWGERPNYKITLQDGPAHDPSFQCCVILADEELGRGRGTTKKEAGQNAAQVALSSVQAWESKVSLQLRSTT